MNRVQLSILTLYFSFFGINLWGQCDNRSLHFDGVDDCVELTGGIYGSQTSFTVEFWMKSYNIPTSPPPCTKKYIYTLQTGSEVSLYECNNVLYFEDYSSAAGTQSVFLNTPGYSSNSWHHIAIVTVPGGLEIYYDGASSGFLSGLSFHDIDDDQYIGSQDLPPNLNETFHGEIDEFRVWNYQKTQMEIDKERFCVADTSDYRLLSYFRLDQGNANNQTNYPTNDNTVINEIYDSGPFDHNAQLVNFSMLGQTSNFICSNSPMIYPIFESIDPVITDYATRQDTLSMICSGDPFHICLKDSLGNAVSNTSKVDTIIWEYDNGTGWAPVQVSGFDGLCFGVLPGQFTIDCSNSTTGYEDWILRCALDVENSTGDSCWYYSDTTMLRIFCPLDASLTSIDAICEDDSMDYVIDLLSPYPFITIPAPNIKIDWTFSDGNGVVSLNTFKDMPQANIVDVLSPPGQACFTANIVDTISGKTNTISTCATIEAKPICGKIMADTLYGSLNTVDLSNKIFQICRNDDAKLFAMTPFLNSYYIWQYSADQLTWTNFVDNNPLANTNQLPPFTPGDTVYMRVAGYPTTYPTTPYICEPCFSDTLRIAISAPIIADTIMGPDTICCNSSAILTLQNFDPDLEYTWYCNGDSVANNVSQITATMDGRYYVVSADSCTSDTTNYKYLYCCDIFPEISCPLAPNTCPRVGETVYLTGCSSSSNCLGTLTYSWSWDSGTLVNQNGCNLEHIPDAAGTTYTLIVTNSNGCSETVSKTIIPCP